MNEDRRILRENNIMLKAIVRYLSTNNDVDDFVRNVLANMVAN